MTKKGRGLFKDTKVLRIAPLQTLQTEALMEKFPMEYVTESDVYRMALGRLARDRLSEFENEALFNTAFGKQAIPMRYSS